MRSPIEVWQIPSPVYRLMAVSYAELYKSVSSRRAWPLPGRAARGVERTLYQWVARIPLVGRLAGRWRDDVSGLWALAVAPSPEFEPSMHYLHTGRNRPIRVYETVDARFIHENFLPNSHSLPACSVEVDADQFQQDDHV